MGSNTFSAMATEKDIKRHAKKLRRQGCEVSWNRFAGTVYVRDGDNLVLRAVEKEKGGYWIVTFFSNERIAWDADGDEPKFSAG